MPGKPKGLPKTGGKAKGTPNKATTQAREAISAFVESNIDRLNSWLDRIAEDSPKDAFTCFMSVVEYHVPKLQRQEVSGLNGEPIKLTNVSDNDKAIITQYLKERKKDEL